MVFSHLKEKKKKKNYYVGRSIEACIGVGNKPACHGIASLFLLNVMLAVRAPSPLSSLCMINYQIVARVLQHLKLVATNLRVPWCSTLNADNPLAMRAVRGSNDHSLVRLTAQQQRRAIVEGTIELVLLGNHGLAQRLLPPHEHVVR